MPVGWAVRGIIGAGVQADAFDPVYTSSLARLSSGNLIIDGTPPAYATVGMAVDLGAQKIWMYNPWFGGWNLGTLTAANPATGAGGFSYTISGTLYAAVWVSNDGIDRAIATINFGASSFLYPIPSGFSPWDASATFDPANTGANVTLSSANLTVTGNASTNVWGASRATTGRSTGKWYWEVALVDIGHSGTFETMGLGLVNASANMNAYFDANGAALLGGNPAQGITGVPVGFAYNLTPAIRNAWRNTLSVNGHSSGKWYFEVATNATGTTGQAIGIANHLQLLAALNTGGGEQLGDTTHAIAAYSQSGIRFNGSFIGTSPGFAAGSIYGIAIDFGASKFWFYDPVAAKWNGDVLANQNPATGTGGISFSGMAFPAYAAVEVLQWSTADLFTINFGATAFANAVPSGFGAWG